LIWDPFLHLDQICHSKYSLYISLDDAKRKNQRKIGERKHHPSKLYYYFGSSKLVTCKILSGVPSAPTAKRNLVTS
jgi:hypothetical protein